MGYEGHRLYLVNLKREHSFWGAPKIRNKPIRQYLIVMPSAISTIHAALDRNGQVNIGNAGGIRLRVPRLKPPATPMDIGALTTRESLNSATGCIATR